MSAILDRSAQIAVPLVLLFLPSCGRYASAPPAGGVPSVSPMAECAADEYYELRPRVADLYWAPGTFKERLDRWYAGYWFFWAFTGTHQTHKDGFGSEYLPRKG